MSKLRHFVADSGGASDSDDPGRIDLCSYGVTDSLARALGRAMCGATHIHTLLLQGNAIAELGAADLAKAFESMRLMSLDLSANRFGREGVAALVDGLRSCSCLTQLSLMQNAITDEVLPGFDRLCLWTLCMLWRSCCIVHC